jgi:hypothetical protein
MKILIGKEKQAKILPSILGAMDIPAIIKQRFKTLLLNFVFAMGN